VVKGSPVPVMISRPGEEESEPREADPAARLAGR
jgi:hypothetical protein